MPGSMANMLDQLGVPVHARTIEALAAPLADGIHLPAPRGVFSALCGAPGGAPEGAGRLMLIDFALPPDYFTPLELPLVLERAHAAGVAEMVTIGTTLTQSEKLPPLTETYPGIWCTVGVHPHHAAEAPIPEPETLGGHDPASQSDRHRRVRLIILRPQPARRSGREFRANIRAAQLAGVPLAIHARDADDDIATILREETSRGGRLPSCCIASVQRVRWPRRRWNWVGRSASPAF